MAGISTTVLYPNTPGKRFNIDYYVNEHMPLAEKIWGPLGMKDWKVIAFKDSEDGSKPPYRYKAVSYWKSLENLKICTTTDAGKQVLEDAVNFTDEVPILLVGEDLASSTQTQ